MTTEQSIETPKESCGTHWGMKKTITIRGVDITVREVIVADILDTINTAKNDGLGQLIGHCADLLPKAVDCDPAFLRNLTPSELKKIYEAFKEVNAVFFDTAAAAGLPQILTSMRNQIVGNFSNLFSALLARATAKPSGDTPGAIS